MILSSFPVSTTNPTNACIKNQIKILQVSSSSVTMLLDANHEGISASFAAVFSCRKGAGSNRAPGRFLRSDWLIRTQDAVTGCGAQSCKKEVNGAERLTQHICLCGIEPLPVTLWPAGPVNQTGGFSPDETHFSFWTATLDVSVALCCTLCARSRDYVCTCVCRSVLKAFYHLSYRI